MAKKPVVTGPVMSQEAQAAPVAAPKGSKAGWCKFKSKQRCYISGVQLEPDQEITLSPLDAYEQRGNKNLELVAGEIPVLPKEDGAPVLEDGDPKVGPSPEGFRLIRPA